MAILDGKNIVIGMTGGIACYKACELVSALKKLGASVDIIMTRNACEFVKPLTLETLSKRPVITDTFSRSQPWEVQHVSLAKKADLFLIAPASANIIAKAALGIADDMLSTTYLACNAPKMICPAMNTVMIEAESTVNNMKLLAERGVIFIEGMSGMLACGDEGRGRMAEPDEILNAVVDFFAPKRDLEGKTVVVTAGGTEESIDAVRVITNHSSGKMGIALAREAKLRGASVTLIKARTSVPVPNDIEIVDVVSTDDMAREVLLRADSDYTIMAAAPSDYKVINKSNKKIKSETLTLELVKNIDISAEFAKIKKGKLIIFSAETENLIENAIAKLSKKSADMVVANNVLLEGAGFNADTNIISIITRDGKITDYEKMSKDEAARVIIDNMVNL